MPRLTVEKIYGEAKREVLKQLVAYNTQAAGKANYQPLAITVRDGRKIVGGLIGATFWDWLFVELLWVAAEKRRKGLGKALLQKAETEARKRGARNAYLNTYSFQAPGFYKKLGYRQFGELSNFPAGHKHHWLTKALDDL
jgi:GNAT superfamily N-acetyltransferase